MADEPSSPFLELLRGVSLSAEERSFFARSDTRATLHKVRLLSAAAVYFNSLAVADFGGRLGPVRARGLVEQVIGAAFQTFGDTDPHPSPFDKAAMLLRGITQGHPFNDGNKRTGLLVASYYLDLVGRPYPPHLPVEATIALCLRVSAGQIRDVAIIAAELERLWRGDPSESQAG